MLKIRARPVGKAMVDALLICPEDEAFTVVWQSYQVAKFEDILSSGFRVSCRMIEQQNLGPLV